METIKEIFQSIYDSYRARIKSPLVGSFIFTFLVWNWKVIAILFYSDWPINCRIEWIENNYLNWCEQWYNYVVPFLVSLFYVMGLPYVNLEIEKVLTKYSKTKLEKKNTAKLASYDQMEKEAIKERKVADAKAGTSEISQLNERNEALLLEMKNLIDQSKSDSDRHNTTISQLKTKEEDYKREIILLEKELSNTRDNIKYDSLKMLFTDTKNKVIEADKTLSKEDKTFFSEYFYRLNTGLTTVMDNDHVNKFSRLELISIDTSKNGKPVFNLTEEGKQFYNFLRNEGYEPDRADL